MSTLILWSLLISSIAGLLIFDLNMAWKYYLKRGHRVKGWISFLRWWAKKSKVKLAVVGVVTVFTSLALIFQGGALRLPEFLPTVTLSRNSQVGLGVALLIVGYFAFDLFMNLRSRRMSRKGHRAHSMRFYRSWLSQSALRFFVVAGVTCLVLSGAWAVNRYNLVTVKTDTSAYMTKALNYFEEKKYKEASVELRNVIRLNAADSEAYIWLARACYRQNKVAEARNAYLEAARIEPEIYSAHMELVYLSVTEHDPKTALAAVEKAERLDPNRVEPQLFRAKCYLMMGKREQALALCRSLMFREFPKQQERQLLIDTMREMGANTEALQVAEAGLKLSPNDLPFTLSRTELLELSGRGVEAVASLRAVAAATNSADAYLLLGDLLKRRSEFPAALDAYEEVLKRSPNNELARKNVAILKAKHLK